MSFNAIISDIRTKKRFRYELLFLLIVSLIFLYYVYNLFSGNINNIAQEKYIITNPQRIKCGLLISIIVLSLYRFFKFNVIYPILFVAGSIYIIIFPYFTVVDETYHFAYIDYLANHYRIPFVQEFIPNRVFAVAQKFYPNPSPTDPATLGLFGRQYEAFQPPLYYIIGAIVYKFSLGNAYLAVYLIKFLGLFFLLSSVFIIKKMYELCINNNILKRNDFVIFSVAILFSINPGYMLRMLTISNVNLLPVLGALHLYFILKYSLEKTLNYKYQIVIMAILTAAVALTQFTAIYLIPITAVFILWKKDIKQCLYYCVTVVSIMAPWFIMNYYYYGVSTAGNIVMDMQRSVVNPNNDSYGLWYVALNLPRMFVYFWNPQEGAYPEQPLFLLIEYLTMFTVIAIISVLYKYSKSICNRNPKSLFFVFCSAAVIGNVAIIIFITMSQSWDILIGRYIYMSTSELAILCFVYIGMLRKESKIIISITLLIIALLLYTNFLGKITSDKIIHRDKHTISLDSKNLG
ncbi:hypothetical protein BC351_32025 [Paenibacillus ferrarius]|uniref:Glycosyltransferase RgtA/B/C/D-like domain-containing protein n=1 Tax=Paenibacillus ferrarius TaxID=1469647 RepID=A0A1V4HEE3_9BACL|nr:hypothetical protein [Paenibacillus ferrarius]OPH53109.1 hypothetical protein BC351_32025 [Paenibacillus ferrarius]